MTTYQELKENNKNLSTKEVAKILREHLKKQYPSLKFSVTCQYYSMGSSLHVHLMQSHFNMIVPFNKLSQDAIYNYTQYLNNYTIEQLKEIQNKKYHQLNHFSFLEEYKSDIWNNGIFLTEKCHKVFREIMNFISQYHYDESDPMTDYFNTNFYIHLYIGKWDKDYIYNKEIE